MPRMWQYTGTTSREALAYVRQAVEEVEQAGSEVRACKALVRAKPTSGNVRRLVRAEDDEVKYARRLAKVVRLFLRRTESEKR